MTDNEYQGLSEEEVQALAEGGFADIVSKINERLYGLEQSTWVGGALTASDAAAGVFSWQNNTGRDVVVLDVQIRVSTVSTGACTLAVGSAATAVSSNNLIDGLSVASPAAGVYNNMLDYGTNGKFRQTVPAGQYITASKASGATAGLVGRYAFRYR